MTLMSGTLTKIAGYPGGPLLLDIPEPGLCIGYPVLGERFEFQRGGQLLKGMSTSAVQSIEETTTGFKITTLYSEYEFILKVH